MKSSGPYGGGPSDPDPLTANTHFNYNNRPRRDSFWGLLFFVALIATAAGGIYGITHRNPQFTSLFSDSDYAQDPRNCPYSSEHELRRLLLEKDQPMDLPHFFRAASLWLGVSAAAAFLLGLGSLLAFQKYSGFMTRLTINLQIAIPLAAGIAALLTGNFWGGVMLLGLAGLVFFVFVLWRNEIDLCARLLGVAAHALRENTGLLLVVIVIKIVLVLLVLPMFGLMFLAFTNGEVVPNDAREGRKSCTDDQGDEVPCCVWQPDGWVSPYMTLAGLTLLWTIATVSELRLFVISGTIAQWYWAVGSHAGSTLRSLRHGLTSSFGSLALGGAILTLIQVARNALQQAQQQEGANQNIFIQLCTCLLQCIYSLLEYLTKFATVSIAITGEAFIEGARHATDLLKRNFLKAYGVWWFPPMVLQTSAFLFSLAWATLIASLYYMLDSKRPAIGQEAILLGVLSLIMAWVVQAFFASVLLNVVDATFFCYAIDKDQHAVTNLEVHDIFTQVPVGVAVQQPGGEYAYGTAPQYGYAAPSAPGAMPGATRAPYYSVDRGYEPDSASRV